MLAHLARQQYHGCDEQDGYHGVIQIVVLMARHIAAPITMNHYKQCGGHQGVKLSAVGIGEAVKMTGSISLLLS